MGGITVLKRRTAVCFGAVDFKQGSVAALPAAIVGLPGRIVCLHARVGGLLAHLAG
jgi:hypothetical protein